MSEHLPRLFRRVLLDLPGQAADARAMRAVAELAAALDAELRALFVEDEDLLALSRLPFVRELRLPEHAWRPVAGETLAADLRLAAERARRMLEESAAELGVRCHLDVRRGGEVGPGSGAHDIVVICEPAHGPARSLGSYARRRRAAYSAVSALMLMPPGGPPGNGAVVALIGSAEDPALATAARVALRLNCGLVTLAPAGVDAAAAAAGFGITPARLTARVLHGRDSNAIAASLKGVPSRLLVLTREAVVGDGEEAMSRLATLTGLAVLAVEPATA